VKGKLYKVVSLNNFEDIEQVKRNSLASIVNHFVG